MYKEEYASHVRHLDPDNLKETVFFSWIYSNTTLHVQFSSQ